MDINGYVVDTQFATGVAGRSQWAFASRGGRSLFIKRFLMPTYPTRPISDKEVQLAKLARCERFEARHRAVDLALAKQGAWSENLVLTEDFFRSGTHYYKVTRRIDGPSVAALPDAWLSADAVLEIALGIASGLTILHSRGLVHGDIAPENVLVTRRPDNSLTSTVIDIDECFPSGSPPPVAEHCAHLGFLAPETARYLTGNGFASDLTTKSDMYSLGLVLSELLERLNPGSAPAVQRLIDTLLSPDPRDRPAARAIAAADWH